VTLHSKKHQIQDLRDQLLAERRKNKALLSAVMRLQRQQDVGRETKPEQRPFVPALNGTSPRRRLWLRARK
jgi:hypothetical protein